jgi:hypothetical protein
MASGKRGQSALAVPAPSGADLAYSAARAAISAVPGFGGSAAEFMQVFFARPIEKRRDEWMKRMAATVLDEALRSIFLGYIDSFSEWRVRVLRVFQAPAAACAVTELYQIVEQAYPELAPNLNDGGPACDSRLWTGMPAWRWLKLGASTARQFLSDDVK